MKELRLATTSKEFTRLVDLRQVNIERASTNPNENAVYNALPLVDGNNKSMLWERQYLFGYRILDFYCKDFKIAVEVDGVEHDQEYDNYRDEYLFRVYGIVVLRVRNNNPTDLCNLVKSLKNMGRSTYNKRNTIFSGILGKNPSHTNKEELSRVIPYDSDHSLLGKFLLERGVTSDYQKFTKKTKSHWNMIVKRYSGTLIKIKDKSGVQQAIDSLEVPYVNCKGDYLINPSNRDLIIYKKWGTVTDTMSVLKKDNSFSHQGQTGSGLRDFLSKMGRECDEIVARVGSNYGEFGHSDDVVPTGNVKKITLKEYINARCGNSTKAATDKELSVFSADRLHGWYDRHTNNSVESSKVVLLINAVIKRKSVSDYARNNLKKYLAKLSL